MFSDWIKLVKVGMPNISGRSLARFSLITLALASRSIFSTNKIQFQGTKFKSEIWNSLNLWLQFQIKYINQKDWARCPAILAVAGGYASAIDLTNVRINAQDIRNSERIAQYYAKGFRGYEHQDYKNWILRVTACIRKAEDLCGELILSESIGVAEIGPGMGAVLAIAELNNVTLYSSYDTEEMQYIQKYILKCMQIPKTFCEFYGVNSKNNYYNIATPSGEFTLFAFWSFTEVDIDERIHYFNLIKHSKTTVIACNKNFEGTDNFLYLEKIAQILSKRVRYVEFVEIFGNKIPGYQQSHRLYVLN
jgi:hypothetical protein